MYFFVFADQERARVYYGPDGTLAAIVATYSGSEVSALAPVLARKAVLAATGEAQQSAPDGTSEQSYCVTFSRAVDGAYGVFTVKRSNA